MEKKNAVAILIGSALIWTAVIVGCALVLRGTEYKEMVKKITFIGVIIHIPLFNTMLLWGRKKKEGYDFKPAATIIASAIIWGVVMIAAGSVLIGTEFKDEVLRTIQYGAIAHLLFIWAPMGILAQKFNKKKKDM